MVSGIVIDNILLFIKLKNVLRECYQHTQQQHSNCQKFLKIGTHINILQRDSLVYVMSKVTLSDVVNSI